MKKVLKISLGVIFGLALLGTFYFLWNKTRPVKTVYEIVQPQIDTIQKRAVATGKVEPRDEVLIKPQIQGIISDLYKEAGEMVHEGDVIARVKVIPDMAQLNSAESRLNIAKISFDQGNKDYERVKALYQNGVVSKEDYETAEASYAKLKEDIQNAQDNLEIVQNGIASRKAEQSNTQIRATVTGIILDIPVKIGNSVIQANTFNEGTTIASIADLNDMIFRGKVDETEVGKLKENMDVVLTIGALQETSLKARLEYVAPKGVEENGVVMFEIKAAAQIPDSIFVRAGYSANADIVIDRREGAVTIPESTIEFEGDKTFVNILTSDSTAVDQTFERKEIKIGLSDGVKVEVTEGLKGGENIRGNAKAK